MKSQDDYLKYLAGIKEDAEAATAAKEKSKKQSVSQAVIDELNKTANVKIAYEAMIEVDNSFYQTEPYVYANIKDAKEKLKDTYIAVYKAETVMVGVEKDYDPYGSVPLIGGQSSINKKPVEVKEPETKFYIQMVNLPKETWKLVNASKLKLFIHKIKSFFKKR